MVAVVSQMERDLQKFQTSNPWIFDLIKSFAGHGSPIPWGQSASVRGGYVGYMSSPYQAAESAVSQLDFSVEATTSREATQAAKQLFDQTKDFWDKAQSMGSIAWETFTGGGVEVAQEAFAVFLGTAFEHLKIGYQLHASGIAVAFLRDAELRVSKEVQKGKVSQVEAVGIISSAEKALQLHASSINDGMSAIAYLNRNGWLESQKKSSVQGIFGGPVLVILGIVAIAAAALTIVAVYQIMTVNKVITEQCAKFSDERLRSACISEALRKLPHIDFGAITGQFMKWLVIGALVVGGVVFLPTVVRSTVGGVRALK